MVKTSVPPETSEVTCPACGAGIRATRSAKRRRVQCPKCREVVSLESTYPQEPEAPALPLEKPVASAEERSRMELLEARVELLEAALAGAMAAAHAATLPAAQRKLIWITTAPGQTAEFSSEQDLALSYNLTGVRSQAIAIRTPAGDAVARAHAEWFKSVFERAGWTVRGPEDTASRTALSGLCLAVPDVPVNKDTAETYLALKAAGFDPIPILDPTPRGERVEGTPGLTLTVPGRVT